MKPMSPIFYIFSISGIFLLGITGYLAKDKINFIKESIKTEGTVVGVKTRERQDSDTGKRSKTYAPIVKFTDKNNNTYDFSSSVSSNKITYKEGDKIPIIYLPEQR